MRVPSSAVLLAVTLLCTSHAAWSQAKRPITERDLFQFTWVADPQLSPDGSRVAFTRVAVDGKRTGYETSIWTVATTGNEAPVRMTNGKHDARPRWSADGRRIAFARGGVGMVAASDYALATTAAQVRLSELALGIGPFVVGPVIERRIGVGNYAALGIDAAAWRGAEWAHQRGLYAELLPDGAALDARLAALSRQLAASNHEAVTAMKRVFWEGTEHWRELLAARARLSGTLVVSPFARQAIERLSNRV